MNEHFLTGFVKAAQAAGIPDEQIASMLQQQGGEAPEAAMPPAEAPEGSPAEQSMLGGHEEEIEHLLSQLSPEELEQLVNEVTQMQQGQGQGLEGAVHGEEAEQIPGVAAGIEQQLSQHPEVAEQTAPQPNPDEATLAKQSAINFIKSANYVEGFLEQALGRGLGLKQAVELYDSAFTTTFNQLKQSELKGDQHKLDVDGDGKIEGSDLAALRNGKKKTEDSVDEKTAAYYEGVLERAREYGMSDAEAIQVVKEAMDKQAGIGSAFERGMTSLKEVGHDTINSAKEIAKKKPRTTAALGLGAAGVGGVALGRASKD
jgi:hypothetical protein